MAKALLGFTPGSDPRAAAALASHNRVLRQRVADLEHLVLQLQAENEALSALVSDPQVEIFQPA